MTTTGNMVEIEAVHKNNMDLHRYGPGLVAVFGT